MSTETPDPSERALRDLPRVTAHIKSTLARLPPVQGMGLAISVMRWDEQIELRALPLEIK